MVNENRIPHYFAESFWSGLVWCMHLSTTCTNWPGRTGNWRKTCPGRFMRGIIFLFHPVSNGDVSFSAWKRSPGFVVADGRERKLRAPVLYFFFFSDPKQVKKLRAVFFCRRKPIKNFGAHLLSVLKISFGHTRISWKRGHSNNNRAKYTHRRYHWLKLARAILSFLIREQTQRGGRRAQRNPKCDKNGVFASPCGKKKVVLPEWVLNFAILNKFYCERIQCKDPKHQSSTAGGVSHMAATLRFFFYSLLRAPRKCSRSLARQEHTQI